MRKLISAYLFLALALSSVAFAKPSNERGIRRAARVQRICEDFLSDSRYEESRVLLGETRAPIMALKPEKGSIEDRSPGVVAELNRIHDDLFRRKEQIRHDGERPEAIKKMFERYASQLTELRTDHSEPRLYRMLRGIIASASAKADAAGTSTTPLHDLVTGLNSRLWEITVACFFAGEDILLNQRISDLYPEQYAKALENEEELPESRRPNWNRELDIVIKMRDGSWRWIEVKDWQPQSTLSDSSKKSVRIQSRGQDLVRQALGLDIELLLVMKYGTPGLDYLQYRVESQYDDMLFVFPEGMPQY